ncbi:hypothetical protein DV738_g1835, partial [Chaetothyriales sp. CBS 135597]
MSSPLQRLLPWNKTEDGFGKPPKDVDLQDDCTSCRVLGSTALVSLGGYTYFSGMRQLRLQSQAIELSKSKYKVGSRQLGIVLLSSTLVGLGMYRMIN